MFTKTKRALDLSDNALALCLLAAARPAYISLCSAKEQELSEFSPITEWLGGVSERNSVASQAAKD